MARVPEKEILLDDRLRQLLRDLSRSLNDVVSESTDVSEKLKLIRQEGYSVYLLLDCKKDGEDQCALEPAIAPEPEAAPPARQLPPGQSNFRIDGTDLSFLRSIGIDPTRRSRGRRSPRPAVTRQPKSGSRDSS